MIRVLHVAAEAAPFARTGGLGDVLGALPGELQQQGVDVRVILPRYQSIPQAYQEQMTIVGTIAVPLGWRQQTCELAVLEYGGITYYFVGNDYYFGRDGIYGFADDCERFAFFSRAVLESLPCLDFQPDILHCHDWHAGLVSVFLAALYGREPLYDRLRTVFTIHNLQYQGNFPKEIMDDMLGLSWDYFTPDRLELAGQVSFIKGGVAFSDAITTVSESYAAEIVQPEYGYNLDGLLRQRQDSLVGITNGIDYSVYHPGKNPHLFCRFDARSLRRRRENKLRLQKQLKLAGGVDIPMIGVVSRLVSSKGIDLILASAEPVLALGAQLVVLGLGDPAYEQAFTELARRYPEQVSVILAFDAVREHRIYAGADIFLMPSRYEPCGLSQQNALRYGCIPVAHAVGGLKDTIVSYDTVTEEGNGLLFHQGTAEELLAALSKALRLYRDKRIWIKLIRSAMKTDCSWQGPAKEYVSMYSRLLTG